MCQRTVKIERFSVIFAKKSEKMATEYIPGVFLRAYSEGYNSEIFSFTWLYFS